MIPAMACLDLEERQRRERFMRLPLRDYFGGRSRRRVMQTVAMCVLAFVVVVVLLAMAHA